jgi:hypothetical protein
MTEEDWEPARIFFEERKLRRADLGGAGDWIGWSEELDGVCHYIYPFFRGELSNVYAGILQSSGDKSDHTSSPSFKDIRTFFTNPIQARSWSKANPHLYSTAR